MAEIPRFLSTCPICNQEFDNVEEHISKAHCKDQVDLGFIKWVMQIHKKVEEVHRQLVGQNIAMGMYSDPKLFPQNRGNLIN
jgi:hypothetical protein